MHKKSLEAAEHLQKHGDSLLADKDTDGDNESIGGESADSPLPPAPPARIKRHNSSSGRRAKANRQASGGKRAAETSDCAGEGDGAPQVGGMLGTTLASMAAASHAPLFYSAGSNAPAFFTNAGNGYFFTA